MRVLRFIFGFNTQILRFICLTIGKWFRGPTNKNPLQGSTLMHPDPAPQAGWLFSRHLVLCSCWIDPHMNYGLKRTNLLTWRLVTFKWVSGRCISPSSRVNQERCCGAPSPPGSQFPMSSPSLELPGPGCEGSSYGVRGWRGDRKEGVNE